MKNNTINLQKEIILEILKYDNSENLVELLKNSDINWIDVLGFLTYHRVAGLAYEKLKNINVRLLDYPVYFTIYLINQAQKERLLLQNKWAYKISEELISNNIKHAFLKGTILNNTLFESGSRVSNDIDILICKNDIPTVTKILKNLGFIQGKYDYQKNLIKEFTKEEIENSIQTRGETAPFVMANDDGLLKTIDVDINFSIDWQPQNNDEITNYYLDNRVLEKTQNGNSLYSLNCYHNFIELCIHFYKDSCLIDILKKRKVLDLYKFIDIYYYIKKYFVNMNMEKLHADIVRFHLEKYIYFAIKYIINIFPDANTEKVQSLIKMLNCDDSDLNIIFDQYNHNIKMTTDIQIIERIFSYNIINKYSEVKENDKYN